MKLLILSELLLEGKLDDLERKYGPRIQEILTSDYSDKSPRDIINFLHQTDISKNKSLTNWLLKLFLTRDIRTGDFNTDYVQFVLEKYKTNKELFAGKDITTFSTLQQVIDVIENAPISNTKADKELKKHLLDTKQIVFEQETERGILYSVHTKEAMQWIGRKTKWCVSAQNDNKFKGHYRKHNPLYVWFDKPTNERYCFDRQSMEFNDEKNESVIGGEVYNYCRKNLTNGEKMIPISGKTIYTYEDMVIDAEDITDEQTYIDYMNKYLETDVDCSLDDIFCDMADQNKYEYIPAIVYYYTGIGIEHGLYENLPDNIIHFIRQFKKQNIDTPLYTTYSGYVEKFFDFTGLK